MKVRTGFVSNSSSSSFVLAVKKGISKEKIKEAFYAKKDEILEFLKWNLEWLDIGDEYKEPEDAFEAFVTDCVDSIVSYSRNGLDLGEWVVFGGEASNETSDNLDALLYSMVVESDSLKLQFSN